MGKARTRATAVQILWWLSSGLNTSPLPLPTHCKIDGNFQREINKQLGAEWLGSNLELPLSQLYNFKTGLQRVCNRTGLVHTPDGSQCRTWLASSVPPLRKQWVIHIGDGPSRRSRACQVWVIDLQGFTTMPPLAGQLINNLAKSSGQNGWNLWKKQLTPNSQYKHLRVVLTNKFLLPKESVLLFLINEFSVMPGELVQQVGKPGSPGKYSFLIEVVGCQTE